MTKTLSVLTLLLIAAAPASAAEQQTLSRDHPTTSWGKTAIGLDYGGVTAAAGADRCIHWTDGPGSYEADLHLEPKDDCAAGKRCHAR